MTNAVTIAQIAAAGSDGTQTGGIRIPTGTTAQRPVNPPDGLTRFNSTTGALEVYRTSAASWTSIALAEVGSEFFPATSATQILQLRPSASSGYYYIRPDGANTYYVYCDMTTDGGGWMLMINARPNNGGQYYNNNDHNLTTFGSYAAPEFNKSTTSMFGTTKINNFFKMEGFKYGRMTPGPGVSINTGSFTGLYQRIGTTTTAQWGGTQFECSNRSAIASNPALSWVLTQYPTWNAAVSNTSARVGTYTGGGHWYPTTYDNAWQNFWKGDQDGLRFSSTFSGEDYSSIGQNTSPGYWWIKTT